MQLPLPFMPTDENNIQVDIQREQFSFDDVCSQDERRVLENQYGHLFDQTDLFNRRLVSYQGNKGRLLHSWIRYKEGFSADLVDTLLRQFNIKPGNCILEPFSGSATTLLVAKLRGINAVGIELLPVCHLAWAAKSHAFDYDLQELKRIYGLLAMLEPAPPAEGFPHIAITRSAFSPQTEADLMFFTEWCEKRVTDEATKTLLRLILTNILEEVSYTRKDGQYLRWDYRADKVRERNQKRLAQGKSSIRKFDKGSLPTVQTTLLKALAEIINDIRALQTHPIQNGSQKLLQGSALEILPTLESNQFHAVITSPPYCNRYDYTRTYALELAYLGSGEAGIRELRQNQLTCTVENRSKISDLEQHYEALGERDRYAQIANLIQSNAAFVEINRALAQRWDRGEINNKGVLSMVRGYFTELTFVFAEILRTCRSGAHVAFVNDNVRYGGEIIPVDLLSTNLAEQLGFDPMKVYVLPQRKGNSSQQMGKFGREALRKSITIWKKP